MGLGVAHRSVAIAKDRLWATVFGGDEADGLEADSEAESLWSQVTDLPAYRVLRLGKNDNFWEMGNTGPCGPCSEIHLYLGDDPTRQKAVPNLDTEDYVELWNLVFIQYNRSADGSLEPLPDQHVDTGLGFEADLRDFAKRGNHLRYGCVFWPILAGISDMTRKPYRGDHIVPMRVIADHIRTLTFAIADGALPSNEGRGYVLRRILRRAARFGRALDRREPFIFQLVEIVAREMGAAFPEVAKKRDHITRVIRSEEEGFGKTLDRGLEIFETMRAKGRISGADAFRLYDTYGFPSI